MSANVLALGDAVCFGAEYFRLPKASYGKNCRVAQIVNGLA